MTENNAEYKTGAAGLFAAAARGIPSTEEYIKEKLDQLTEFESQRDLIEIKKRELLEEVKIPAEVEAIVANGMKLLGEVENKYQPALKAHRELITAGLAKIVVPDEIKEALAEIDRQRNRIQEFDARQMAAIREQINNDRLELEADINDGTRAVYADVAKRKADIEAEFAGSRQAVEENIEKLKSEIKTATKEIGYTVDGTHYQAIYVKGKKTWNAKRLDAYVERNPEVKSCYDVGDPSVTIRKK